MDEKLAELQAEHGTLSVAQEWEWFGDFDYEFDYLGSNFWKRIRRRIFKRDGKICRCCRKEASEVHHHDYDIETIMGRNDDKLVSLCTRCHGYIEYDNGHKVSDPQIKFCRFNWLVSVSGRLPIDDLEDELRSIGICIHFSLQSKGQWRTLSFSVEKRAANFLSLDSFLYHQALDDRLLTVDGKLLHRLQKRAIDAISKGGAKNICTETNRPRIVYRLVEGTGSIRFPHDHQQSYLENLVKFSDYPLRLMPYDRSTKT